MISQSSLDQPQANINLTIEFHHHPRLSKEVIPVRLHYKGDEFAPALFHPPRPTVSRVWNR
jgi:hypothetical protein